MLQWHITWQKYWYNLVKSKAVYTEGLKRIFPLLSLFYHGCDVVTLILTTVLLALLSTASAWRASSRHEDLITLLQSPTTTSRCHLQTNLEKLGYTYSLFK